MRRERPDLTRPRAEAADWLARLGHRHVTTETLREFRDWRDDPANDVAYQEAEAFWEASGAQAGDPEILRLTEAALARRPRRARPAWPPRAWVGWTLALATGSMAAAGAFAFNRALPSYGTGAGEQRTLRLADGSWMHLNVGSKVRVRFSEGRRRVELIRGEALFDVAHDARRPFLVIVGDDTEVRAVGTRFDVRRDGAEVRVILVEGRVRVAHDGAAPRTLLPNQQLTIPASGEVRQAAADAARATSWTTGRLHFHETPLAAAVAEVNRYAGRPVRLEGPELGDRLVSGHFDVGDAEAFAHGVASLFDLQAATAPDGAIVLRRPPAAPAA